eukprot:CAMPEP_0171196040 /NCGR_PEP_ID=MMETSP0790-20130122/21700_1 /TAXON_ID=2925 /ORGANISM="Alexandrium catenella, Strain OF101" /LENGTH=91 /DNA_ID=CAMNT_0011661257 /DNA_START=140 /DNA_END=415 /DNA_ORIENTATION=+
MAIVNSIIPCVRRLKSSMISSCVGWPSFTSQAAAAPLGLQAQRSFVRRSTNPESAKAKAGVTNPPHSRAFRDSWSSSSVIAPTAAHMDVTS